MYMAKQGPETKLVVKARAKAKAIYGNRYLDIKQHGSQFTRSGVSDVLAVVDGVFVACEFKAPESYGGSRDRAVEEGPTLLQRSFVEKVREAGGVAGFAAHEDDYMALLKKAETKAAVLNEKGIDND